MLLCFLIFLYHLVVNKDYHRNIVFKTEKILYTIIVMKISSSCLYQTVPCSYRWSYVRLSAECDLHYFQLLIYCMKDIRTKMIVFDMASLLLTWHWKMCCELQSDISCINFVVVLLVTFITKTYLSTVMYDKNPGVCCWHCSHVFLFTNVCMWLAFWPSLTSLF